MTIPEQIWKNIKQVIDQTYSIVGSDDGQLWLEFDTIDECTTTGRASVTQYPTEVGTIGVDYKYSQPDSVTMTGLISEGGFLARSSIFPRMGTFDKKSAIEKIREKLKTLKSNITLVDIQTRNAGLRTNLTLINYEIEESYDTYGIMSVSMTFQEVLKFDTDGQTVAKVSDKKTENGGVTMTEIWNDTKSMARNSFFIESEK